MNLPRLPQDKMLDGLTGIQQWAFHEGIYDAATQAVAQHILTWYLRGVGTACLSIFGVRDYIASSCLEGSHAKLNARLTAAHPGMYVLLGKICFFSFLFFANLLRGNFSISLRCICVRHFKTLSLLRIS